MNIKLLGEIPNNWPNDLFGANVCKTLELFLNRESLKKILHWTNTTSIGGNFCYFHSYLSYSVLLSNFIAWGVKCLRQYPVLILNAILIDILFTNILVGGILITISCWISDTDYYLSDSSNLIFHIRFDTWTLLFFYDFLHILSCKIDTKIWWINKLISSL